MKLKHSLRRFAAVGLVGAASGVLASCEDLLQESPPNLLTADNLYSSVAGFEAGLNGLYAFVREEHQGLEGGGNNAHRPLLWSTGVDNAAGRNDLSAQLVNELGTRLNSTDLRLRLLWNWLYATINSANTLILRAENPDINWTQAKKNQVVAEARLIRAWAYRHLTYLWGDVPLHLTESSGDAIKTDWERTPVALVRAQIEQDLLFAEANLPPINGDRLGRPVAQHYLAELYLTLGKNADAEAKAAAVIGSGQYRLITARYGIRAGQPGVPFMDQFVDGNALRSQGNTEVLWSIQNQQNIAGGGANQQRRAWVPSYAEIPGIALSVEHGGRGVGRGRLTRWAMELYEPQDDRGSIHALRRFYIYNTNTGLPAGRRLGDTLWLEVKDERLVDETQISTRKWDWADPQRLSTEARSWPDVPYLRVADTYLLLAEAQFKQGKLSQAADNLNILRRRARATEIAPAQVTLDFILDERSRELLTEEHRRYTLVRTGTLVDRVRRYNKIVGPLIRDHHVLLPIPQSVIDANLTRDMPQNPGY